MNDTSTIWQRAEQLLRHLRGELNAAEEADLEIWLEEHPEHQELLSQLVNDAGLDEDLSYISSIRQEQAWADLKQKLNIVTKPAARQLPLWKKLTAAAGIIMAIAAGLWFYSSSRHPGDRRELLNYSNDIAPGKNTAILALAGGKVIKLDTNKNSVIVADSVHTAVMLTAATPMGGTYQFTLSDGTKVWLNAASKIIFPSHFSGKDRKVLLEGEAYFSVVHNEKQPFLVESKDQVVEDIGTEFNINAYNDEPAFITTLVEGSAAVNGTVIIPGQQATLKDNGIKVSNVDPALAIAWKMGRFTYKNTPLDMVMRQIARWYDIEVNYANEELKNELFSGSVSRYDKVSRILKTIEFTGVVKFKLQGKKLLVTK